MPSPAPREPTAKEWEAIGVIRARSMTRLYGLNSPRTIEVLETNAKRAQEAREKEEQT